MRKFLFKLKLLNFKKRKMSHKLREREYIGEVIERGVSADGGSGGPVVVMVMPW